MRAAALATLAACASLWLVPESVLAAAAKPSVASTTFSACAARYAAIGLPAMKTDGSDDGPIALCNAGYAVGFNPDTRTPDWVIERLPGDFLTGNAVRKNNFTADSRVGDASATNKDYPGSPTKYDKGHQAPAADFKSSQDMTDKSFLFTNMGPQIGAGFNRNIWKQLETDIRTWIVCGSRPELYVITGPVFGDKEKWIPTAKNKQVRVPDSYFKVIYDPTHNRALGMLLPNAKLKTTDLPKYAVAISDIEEQTGIVFFPKLTARQRNILKNSAGTFWKADASCNANVSE